MKFVTSVLAFTLTTLASTPSFASADQAIRIVGSSTVYPFVTVVAEKFGTKTKNKTPIVESTGTGGGFKLFCETKGKNAPDLTNASRPIKPSEVALCKKNGITSISEITIGYDGIVIASKRGTPSFGLTKDQLFKALAKQVVVNGKLVNNPYKNWNQINKSLPAKKIEVYGPPPTSGTRDAFVELVFEGVCTKDPVFKAAYKNEDNLKKACHTIREDGAYIEAGENDNLIVQKLVANPHALGVFGYSFYEENEQKLQVASMNGIKPTYENIAKGSYQVSRPLFVYANDAKVKQNPAIQLFIKELISEGAIGPDGYLPYEGLIPLPDKVRKQLQSATLSKLQ